MVQSFSGGAFSASGPLQKSWSAVLWFVLLESSQACSKTRSDNRLPRSLFFPRGL